MWIHVEPVKAGLKKPGSVAKGSFIKGGFCPAKWRSDLLTWPGLTLLVASLRPQLADLSCDAAGSGILACSEAGLGLQSHQRWDACKVFQWPANI